MDGIVPGLTSRERTELRRALRHLYPWLVSGSWGPSTVDAGTCDGCGQHPRLAATCGPDGRRLCRQCLLDGGTGAWCDGHHEQACEVLDAVRELDDDWAEITTLWWYSTGELQADESWLELLARRPGLRAAIDAGDV